MSVGTQATIEAFDRIATRAENADRRLEYVGGEIVEVVSNNYASAVAARILIKIGGYVEAHGLGYITGADGGYRVSGERYIPDMAFVSTAKQPEPSHETYNPQPPDLAVEVLSPTDSADIVRLKVANYLAAGTLVWLVNPEARTVEVYRPGRPAQRLTAGETLEGDVVLPGFTLPVRDLFSA